MPIGCPLRLRPSGRLCGAVRGRPPCLMAGDKPDDATIVDATVVTISNAFVTKAPVTVAVALSHTCPGLYRAPVRYATAVW